MSTPRARHRSAPLCALALLVAIPGCTGAPDAPSRPPAREERPADPRILRWSAPVLYHGVEVRLELAGDGRGATIERTESGDRLTCGDLWIGHRFQRFETAGARHFRFDEGSRVFIFRSPTPEAPWETTAAGLALVWPGNGLSPVVQEDRRAGSVLWYLGRGEVERRADGSVVHRYRDSEAEWSHPVTLLIGREGELLEAKRGVR